MMISPDSYIDEFKNKKYKELVVEKNKLLKEISDFENNNIPEESYNINPSPDVIYQCNLLYLSKLCELIADKFNKEYEWNIDD